MGCLASGYVSRGGGVRYKAGLQHYTLRSLQKFLEVSMDAAQRNVLGTLIKYNLQQLYHCLETKQQVQIFNVFGSRTSIVWLQYSEF
jgi:hypothetical protein